MQESEDKPSFARPLEDDPNPTIKSHLIQFALTQREEAEKGNPLAQHMLGLGLLSKGHAEEAFGWFMKAAEQEVAAAQQAVGALLFYGEGVAGDVRAAASWFEKARKEMPLAETSCLILEGKSDREHPTLLEFFAWREQQPEYDSNWAQDAIMRGDYEAAEKYLKRRAASYKPEDQILLAALYRCRRDYDKAIEWFTRAALAGLIDAKVSLAEIYEEKRLLQYNPKAAFNWYLKAAQEGHLRSMSRVAHMYAKGIGTVRNQEEARRWKDKAENSAKEGAPPTLAESIRRKIREIEDGNS